jgi:hypothetical protein
MSGSLGCEGTKNRPKPCKSAGLFSPTDRLAQGSRSCGAVGVGKRSPPPQARQGLSMTGLARVLPRGRLHMVILMVTSSLVKAERNWTATP